MQCSPAQLSERLARGLAPVYLVHGDEPLQLRESLDAVRSHAKAAGYAERLALDVERGFDWNRLRQELGSLSLFAARRLIEVRLPGGKPGDDGARVLRESVASPVDDVVLLVSTGKLDARVLRSAWVKALDAAGVTVQARQVERRRLPAWIRRRAGERGVRLSGDGAALLADRVEGNLLACAQEVDKLALLFPGQTVSAEAVQSAVFDSARYSLFALTDSALEGDATRSLRILRGLRAEGTEPPLVVWALARELRLLSRVVHGLAQGEKLGALLSRNGVWESRKKRVTDAVRRHPPHVPRRLLGELCRIDRVIKGHARGEPWNELERLVLALAGVRFAASGDKGYA
ncbi:MAG: DNA polymerase III subunit delta [Gammaproteobacteria bacterium]|nr:DNA polymerase III subunit delta [Gammaproteobacteria bacterium]